MNGPINDLRIYLSISLNMPELSPLKFSPTELQLVNDTAAFPLKRKIIEKVCVAFHNLAEVLKDNPITQVFPFPEMVNLKAEKITKGENLEGFPYVVMDFAYTFSKADIFTFRTLFWFGHLPSVSLIMKGSGLKDCNPTLLSKDWKVSVDGDIWQNDNNISGFIELKAWDWSKTSQKIRLSKNLTGNNLEKIVIEVEEAYVEILSACSGSSNSF